MAASLRTPRWRRFIPAGAVAAALTVAAASCNLGVGGCTVESRAVEYGAETTSGSLRGTGFLELSETRGAENDAFVLWHFRATPFVGRATTFSLRQGPPEAPGRLLYQFPLVNAVPDSGVVSQVFVRTPFAGEVPFAELWELLQREPVSFHAVLDGDVPLRVGPLLRTGFSDWQEVCS
jgi:hypothetical protein